MNAKQIALLVGALALILGACGTGTITSEEKEQNFSPIINGDLPNEAMHDAVVSLHQRAGDTWYLSIYCSGTLISPTVVMTAAHCVDEGRNYFDPIEPEDVVVYVGDNPMTDPDPWAYIVVEVLAHPNYDSRALTNDIALLRLAGPPDVNPVPALPASLGLTTADEGAVINFAGFGQDEDGNYDQKLQIDGILDHLYSAFQIYYYQNDGGPCFGDSGGPAFIKRGGIPYVAGITSYGDSVCATYGVSTRPDYYDSWINAFIGVIPDPYCGDGTCDADEDCDTCPVDCGACPSQCGDGTCDADETCENCEADCGACPVSFCGDGTCDADEDCDSCQADCGACQVCGAWGDPCDSGADCCSGRCHHRWFYCK